MALEIKPIQSKEQWENFVNDFSPHTFLQSWEWNLSQQVMGNKTFNLGIFNDGKIVGVAFVYIVRARRGSFLFCPHGPLIKEDWEKSFNALFEYLKDLAKKEKLDFIRISPLEIKTPKSVSVFKKLKFKDAPIHTHPELSWMLDVTLPEEDLLKNMKKRTRYSITKAQKDGVEVVGSDGLENIEEFYEVYMETAKRQIFVPFSKEYIKKEFEIFGKEGKILIFFAKYKGPASTRGDDRSSTRGGETIATAMIIYANGSGFYHHGASTRNHSNITASEFLQWHAILEAKKRGLKLYNFWGISPETAENHPWVGITRFKQGFGGFAEEYVHTQDYPLTLKYWLNYVIETARRIKRKY